MKTIHAGEDGGIEHENGLSLIQPLLSQHSIGQPDDNLRVHRADHHTDRLEDQKRHDASVDVAKLNAFEPEPRQIEQRVAERRRQKRHLQIDRQHGDEPQHVETQRLRDGQEDRERDHDDSDPVDEAAQDNVNDHDQNIGAPFSETEPEQRLDDGLASAQAQECPREAGGADDDDDDHRRGLRRLVKRVGKVAPGQLAVGKGHDEGRERTDTGRFCRCGDAEEDRPEDEEDQCQRRHGIAQRVRDALGDRDRGQFLCRHGRAYFRIDAAAYGDIDHVKYSQCHARHNAAHEQLAGRQRGLVGHHDQHDARRDENSQAAARGDHPRRDLTLIAVAEQHWSGQHPHCYNRGADDAGAGGKNDADCDHGKPHTAPDRAEQDPQCLEELVRHTRHRQEVSHENEERDGHQDEIVHRTVDPLDENSEELWPDEDQSEERTDTSEHESEGMSHEQKDDKYDKHADGNNFWAHWLTPLSSARTLMSLIISEMPCKSSMNAVSGMTVLIG